MESGYRSMLLLGLLLGLACSLSLTKLLFCVFAEISPGHGDKTEADVWLQENDLQEYQTYFRERGKENLAAGFNLYFAYRRSILKDIQWTIYHN
jgi:hypothetical protein